MLLVYAVVPADWLPSSPKAASAGLSMLSAGATAVLYEEREDLPASDRDAVLSFGRVVTEVAASGPALPVRYGTVVRNVAELAELLEQRADAWHKRLSAVRGHVELVVHVTDDAAPAKTPAARGSGREYLLSRAGAHRHTEELFREVFAAVAPCCREVRRLPGSDELRVACLVPADGVEGLRSALESWTRDGRRTRVTGPWPPFSFTEEEELS